jgi:hypothetical protein
MLFKLGVEDSLGLPLMHLELFGCNQPLCVKQALQGQILRKEETDHIRREIESVACEIV